MITPEGPVLRLGDDVDTDQIIAAWRCRTDDEAELGRHVFENMDAALATQIAPGTILIAGANFGGGSAREQAPAAIKGAGIRCVVARSFARSFLRNAVNIGLPILVSDAIQHTREGSRASVDLAAAIVVVDGQTVSGEPLPPAAQNIVMAGGMVAYVRERLRSRSAGQALRSDFPARESRPE